MKNLAVLFILLLAVGSEVNAKVVGGLAPFKKMIISCEFMNKSNRILEAHIYSNTPSSNISYAVVSVFEIDEASSQKTKKLAQYKMAYSVPVGQSLVYKFVSVEQKSSLVVFGDDVGGMSTFKLNNQTSPLMCAID